MTGKYVKPAVTAADVAELEALDPGGARAPGGRLIMEAAARVLDGELGRDPDAQTLVRELAAVATGEAGSMGLLRYRIRRSHVCARLRERYGLISRERSPNGQHTILRRAGGSPADYTGAG